MTLAFWGVLGGICWLSIAFAQVPPSLWLAQYYADIGAGIPRDTVADAAYIEEFFSEETQNTISSVTQSLTPSEGRDTRFTQLMSDAAALGARATDIIEKAQSGEADVTEIEDYAADLEGVLDQLSDVRDEWTDEQLDTRFGEGTAAGLDRLKLYLETPALQNSRTGDYALLDFGTAAVAAAFDALQSDPSKLTADQAAALRTPGVLQLVDHFHELGMITDEERAFYLAVPTVEFRSGKPAIQSMGELDALLQEDEVDLNAVASLLEQSGEAIRTMLFTYQRNLPAGDPKRDELEGQLINLRFLRHLTTRGADGELLAEKIEVIGSLIETIEKGQDTDGSAAARLVEIHETDGDAINRMLTAIIATLPDGHPAKQGYVDILGRMNDLAPFVERGTDGLAAVQKPSQLDATQGRLTEIFETVQDFAENNGFSPNERDQLAGFLSKRLGVSRDTLEDLLDEVAQTGNNNLPPGALADLLTELLSSPGLYANIDVIAGRSAVDPDLFSQDDDPSTDFTDITTGGAVTAASELVEVYFIPAGGLEGGLTVYVNRSTGRVGAVGTVDGGPSLPSSYVGSFAGTLDPSSGTISGLFIGHSEALEDDDLDYRQDNGMGTQGRIITTLSFPATLFDGKTGDITTNAISIDPGSIPLSVTSVEETSDAGPAILLRQIPASDLQDTERDFVGYAAGLLISRDDGSLIDNGRTTGAGRDRMVSVNALANTASLDLGSIFSLAGPFEIGNLSDSNIAVFGPQDFFVSEIETPLTDPKFRTAQAGLVPGFSYVGWGRFRADQDRIDAGPPASRDQAIANISFVFGDSALSKAELPTSATANYQGPLAGSGYDASIGPEGHFDITGSVDLDVNFGADTVDGTFSIGAVGNPMPPEIINVDNGVITGDGALDFDLTGTGGFTGINGGGEGRFFGTPGVAEEVGGSFNASDADVTVQGVFAGQKQ